MTPADAHSILRKGNGGYTETAEERREREALELAKKAYPFKTFVDASARAARKPWLIKGVIARGEVSSWRPRARF